MGSRSLLQLSFVAAALTLTPLALADIPNPTGGSAGSSSSSATSGSGASGTGGASSQFDPNCNVAQESIAGDTCQECSTGKGAGVAGDPACGSLSSDYSMACQLNAGTAVYCNGPNRGQPSDQNVNGCSVPLPGAPAQGLAGLGALVAAAAFFMRRRRS